MSHRSFYSPVSRAAYRQALQDRLKGTANIVPYEHILTATITPATDPTADTPEMELGTSHSSGTNTTAGTQAPIDPATLALVRDVYRAEDLSHLTSAPLKFTADWTSVADYTGGGVADFTRPKTDLKADYKIQCLDSYLENLTREMHSKVQLYNQRLYPQQQGTTTTTANNTTTNNNMHLLTSHSNFESASQRSLSNLASSDFDDISLLESIFDINTLTSATYTNTTNDCIIDSLLIPHQKYGADFFPGFAKESKRRDLYTHQETYHNILKLRALYGIQTIDTAQKAIRYVVYYIYILYVYYIFIYINYSCAYFILMYVRYTGYIVYHTYPYMHMHIYYIILYISVLITTLTYIQSHIHVPQQLRLYSTVRARVTRATC